MPMTDNEKPTLLSALLAVQAEISSLKLGRDAEGQIGSRKYRYLTLDKLHAEVLPLLNRNGLVWVTEPSKTVAENDFPRLSYRLIHVETGDSIDNTMPLILGEQTSQALGSAITYARRYALLAVLGLAPVDDDDDGLAASTKPAISQDRSAGARLLSDEERKLLVDAIKDSGQNPQLLLKAEGVEKSDELTVKMGESIMRKLKS